jgi:hypothetical protein
VTGRRTFPAPPPPPRGVKRKRGQPAFRPTEENREMVRLMVAGGIQQPEIAALLRISARSLRTHFRHEIDTATTELAHKVVAAHVKRIEEGDMRAIEWWERSRLGWSEKAPEGSQDQTMRVVVELVGEPLPNARIDAPRQKSNHLRLLDSSAVELKG